MLPKIGPNTGPITLPAPQITITVACSSRGKVASTMPWPIGMIVAPNSPWPTRYRISESRLSATPHMNEQTVKPRTLKNITLRQPSRAASQPVIGVATAVATRFSVMTQEISSWVADMLPRICGSTTLASVIVMPNSKVESCTVSRISHCRALMLNRPGGERTTTAGAGAGSVRPARPGGRRASAIDKRPPKLSPPCDAVAAIVARPHRMPNI